jgi:flagellin-like protein
LAKFKKIKMFIFSMNKKRGLSPVVATVLLISMVIVLGLIVFLWFKGMSDEAITKFDGTNVKLVCEEVSFDATYSGNFVYISNTGDVPIYKIKAKIVSDGSFSTEEIESGWPEVGLNPGGAYSGPVSSGEKLILIPVLIGENQDGKMAYTCEERHGVELSM